MKLDREALESSLPFESKLDTSSQAIHWLSQQYPKAKPLPLMKSRSEIGRFSTMGMSSFMASKTSLIQPLQIPLNSFVI
ncbi:hypothetical protein ACSBR2_019968 [Camellia fascicularis]